MKAKELTRGAGILLAITSLPSSYGIGTLGDAAYRFVDLLVDLKQSYWQVLPIGPTSFGDSPYQSLSAFAGNPYLIDLDDLATEGLLTKTEIRSYNWGTDEADIDYATIYENRFKVLQIAYERFDGNNPAFVLFQEETKYWLEDYALFMALKYHFDGHEWLSWDASLRDRDPEALKEYSKILHNEILFWKFLQYEFFKQWGDLKQYANNRGVSIIGDLPFYVALDSMDVWAHRDLFLLNEDGTPNGVAGVPPDSFTEEGQKWGSPIYDWNRMEADGFDWWKKRMKENAQLFNIIRLDHFVGIVRYYTIPNDAPTAKNGKWSKGPGKKLTDAMEEVLGDTHVIVEDVGLRTPIPGVKKLMNRMGWSGIKILMFAFDDDTANEHLPHNYVDNNLVVYAGTHDNETIVGYFHDKTDYELAYLYEYLNIRCKEDIPDALIRAAYGSIADVVIIQMQDLLKLGNEARMNAPSTVGRNWRWRIGTDTISEERKAWIRTLASVYRR
ncbi:MAG: 4-alpha-glucanotransferase [Roseburia sp.]|nr:4-alpha-glucanotransferase [Roseburia sp.]MDD6217331.1 4-alpha-glucanotransferase [Roseburia sp.]